MYTIVMDKYKNLNTTVRTVIFMKENMADKIQFLIPPTYQDNEIKDYIVTLKYVDPNGNFHSEVLTPDEELYKDYIRYVLPVGTKLTQVSGNLTVRLTLVKYLQGDDTMVIDRMETNSTVIRIERPVGFTDNVDFEDIEAFKAQMNQMSRDITTLQDEMPNDVAIDDNDKLHITHDGEPIGEGVEILVPSDMDLDDDAHDGIVNLDGLKEKEDEDAPEFIELDE